MLGFAQVMICLDSATVSHVLGRDCRMVALRQGVFVMSVPTQDASAGPCSVAINTVVEIRIERTDMGLL